jgi:serine/threonine protein kinase
VGSLRPSTSACFEALASVGTYRRFLYCASFSYLEAPAPTTNSCTSVLALPHSQWSLLYEKKSTVLSGGPWGGMPLDKCMFFAAMCISAFEHIHALKYCYRDLKPENLLMDNDGYLKIADFGFAKKLPYTSKLGKVSGERGGHIASTGGLARGRHMCGILRAREG